MKKRAPTLPPTIIDRGLSMIAMRVTFSRACARARKKKVILYARANARKNAREKVKRKWKKNAFLFRYRYEIHENSLSQTFICTSSLKRNTSKTSNFARKRNHQYSTKRVKLNGKVLNPHIVYDLLEPDFVIYSLLERKVAFDVFFGRISGSKLVKLACKLL